MSKELVCITCPIGCHLQIEELSGGEIQVSGNRCARGATYAREETLAPKRVVTATCRSARKPEVAAHVSLTAPRRVPVRTTGAFPKERIPELLKALYAVEIALPVRRGAMVIKDALGSGIDVIATRSVE